MKQILIKEKKRKGKQIWPPFLFSCEPTITNFPCLQSNQGEFQTTYLTHGHKMHARGDMDWVEKIFRTIVAWKKWICYLMTCLIIDGNSKYYVCFMLGSQYLKPISKFCCCSKAIAGCRQDGKIQICNSNRCTIHHHHCSSPIFNQSHLKHNIFFWISWDSTWERLSLYQFKVRCHVV